MRDISIYIHIPFCVKKCLYCDFNSFSGKNNYFESYKNSLVSEINSFEAKENLLVKTIFFGGGTPSVLPAQFIGEILEAVKNKFKLDEKAEISIEVNPGTVNIEKLNYYRKIGINRISIGVQALQNRLLKALGRIHNKEQFFECFELVKRAGFENINLDLMFALPNQTIEDWKETLNTAIKLNPTHLSVYSLIIEEGTEFFRLFEEGKLNELSEEEDRQMYYLAKEMLAENGYYQYEISNFAKKGFECKHNKVYWKRKEYIGFGLGACSFFNNRRYHNNYELEKYINKEWFGEVEAFSQKDAYAEFMFLGLRMREGVSPKEFFDYFGVSLNEIFGEKIKMLIKQELLAENEDRIFLTEKGIDVSNVVFCEFL